MTQAKFETLMMDLYRYYGMKEGKGKEAHREYFSLMKHFDDAQADRLYSAILRQYKFFPAVSELQELSDALCQKGRRIVNASTCWYCMDRGTIDYYKSGLRPFVDYKYCFAARCPKCDAGKNYKGLPAFDRIMGYEALESIKEHNLKKWKGISSQQQAESIQKVKNFIRLI